MIAIWERMGQFFGQQWERSYGTVEDQTISAWMGALNRFSKDEVESALRAVERDFSGAFPPTFPEFRELCETARKYAKTRQAHQQAEASADRPLMEHLKASATTETGRKAIAEIQQAGRGGFPETKKESYLTLGLQRRWGMPPEHWK